MIPLTWYKLFFTNFKLGGVVDRWVGGWVDFTPIIINPLYSLTVMIKTSKISTQVEIASWAWILDIFINFPETFKQLMKDTFQTYSRHLPDISHTTLGTNQSSSQQVQTASIHQKAVVYNISVIRRVRGARAYVQRIKGLSYLGT